MEIFDAYEVLDKLASKSKIFEMIRDDNKVKDGKIAELEQKNSTLEGAIMELTMALSMMMGGM